MSVPSSVPYPTCQQCKFQTPMISRNICVNCENTSVAAAVGSTQKRIWNTVRLPASEYTMNRAALHVYTPPINNPALGYYGVAWKTSDRAVPGVVHSNVPSHASSTRHSITRMRPGSTSAAGIGVDVKHGSYDRYLARLKGKSVLRTQLPSTAAKTPIMGNKTMKYGVAYTNKCFC